MTSESQPLSIMDLTENQDGGVLKEILREGTGTEKPLAGDKVTVHYVGTLLDGSLFDSSRDRGDKFTFTLGKGEVIKAWDVGVATMRKGELAKLTCKSEYAYGETGSPPKIPPNTTLVFEVELFSWQGEAHLRKGLLIEPEVTPEICSHGEDISQKKDQGIIRSIVHKGEGHSSPNDYSYVHIKYQIYHNDEVVLGETECKFTLGESDDPNIPSGLEMGIKKMKEKERSKLKMAPSYAFGKEGNKDLSIPPDATVTFEVELVSFEKAKHIYEMDAPEKLSQAEIRKQKGTEFFKKGKTDKAIPNYNTILDYLDSESSLEGDEKEKRDALVLAARLNLAACHLRQGNDADVIENCNQAISMSKNNAKAYFRRAQAHQNRKDYSLAVKDFEEVVNLEPDNKAAKNQIVLCRKKVQEDYQREKKLYAGMFSKTTSQDTKKTDSVRGSDDNVFKDGVGVWDNNMAAGMMPLDQEEAAFGDILPTDPGNNGGNNHRY